MQREKWLGCVSERLEVAFLRSFWGSDIDLAAILLGST
jgi:hypothetical protein